MTFVLLVLLLKSESDENESPVQWPGSKEQLIVNSRPWPQLYSVHAHAQPNCQAV